MKPANRQIGAYIVYTYGGTGAHNSLIESGFHSVHAVILHAVIIWICPCLIVFLYRKITTLLLSTKYYYEFFARGLGLYLYNGHSASYLQHVVNK